MKPGPFNALKYEVLMYYTLLYDETAKEPHCNCKKCPGPETTIACLSIDHMKPRTRKDNLSGDKLYEYLKNHNFPESYQVLCFNCNFTKGADGKCAHLWGEY